MYVFFSFVWCSISDNNISERVQVSVGNEALYARRSPAVVRIWPHYREQGCAGLVLRPFTNGRLRAV